MFDAALFQAHVFLCAAAIAVAAFVRPGQRGAVTLAGLLSVNFLWCALAYTPWAPKYALQAIGLDVSSKDIWMVSDALFGAVSLCAFRYWWGWALWATAAVQTGLHIAYQWGALVPITYTDRLTDVLHVQLAVFFFAGGPRACDFVYRHLAGLRRDRMVFASSAGAATE